MNTTILAFTAVINEILIFFRSDKILNVSYRDNLVLKILISLLLIMASSSIIFLLSKFIFWVLSLKYEMYMAIVMLLTVIAFLIRAAQKEDDITVVEESKNDELKDKIEEIK